MLLVMVVTVILGVVVVLVLGVTSLAGSKCNVVVVLVFIMLIVSVFFCLWQL